MKGDRARAREGEEKYISIQAYLILLFLLFTVLIAERMANPSSLYRVVVFFSISFAPLDIECRFSIVTADDPIRKKC